MPESISMDDFMSAIEEIKSHRDLTTHEDCQQCLWVAELIRSAPTFWDLMVHLEPDGWDTLDIIMFLYVGLKLGRRQAYDEAMKLARLNGGETT